MHFKFYRFQNILVGAGPVQFSDCHIANIYLQNALKYFKMEFHFFLPNYRLKINFSWPGIPYPTRSYGKDRVNFVCTNNLIKCLIMLGSLQLTIRMFSPVLTCTGHWQKKTENLQRFLLSCLLFNVSLLYSLFCIMVNVCIGKFPTPTPLLFIIVSVWLFRYNKVHMLFLLGVQKI